MGKREKGLRWRGGAWHIDKRYRGERLFGTTGTADRGEAEQMLASRLAELDERAEEARRYTDEERRREDARRLLGLERIRPHYIWEDAVEKFVRENQHLASLDGCIAPLRTLDPYLRGRPLHRVHNAALAPYRADREGAGISPKSINLALGVVRRIMNLAAREWIDPETDMSWLAQASLIRMEPKAKVPLRQDSCRLF